MIKNKNWHGILLFLAPVLVLYFFFFIYPLGSIILNGFMNWRGTPQKTFVGFENFINLFRHHTFRQALKNNVIWAMALGFVQIPLATLIAMMLNRKPKGWKFLRTVYFVPNVISMVAIAMLWRAVYNAEYGALNGILSFFSGEQWNYNWLGNTGTALPAVILQQLLYIGYFMIIILASLMSIPESYYEAAKIDGANILQQELYITMPMLRGILLTCITLAMAYGLRHFEATFLMTGGGPNHSTTTMGIMLYNRMTELNYGVASAIGSLLIFIGGVLIYTIQALFHKTDPAREGAQ